jgi:phosphoglycolate phosphatase-like HAD superfamily hydrolase
MTPAGIIFDFDGVLVDSVHVKTEAFRALYRHEKRHLADILDYHLANGGLSRFSKFEYIHSEILKRELSEDQMRQLGNKCSRLVKKKVIECDAMPGSLQFLRKYFEQVPLFVASATPQDELREIVTRRGLMEYFREIHGAPRNKPEIIRDILNRNQLAAGDLPFVGDAVNDYLASCEMGLPFFAFIANGNPNAFPAQTTVVRTFSELERHLFGS